MDFKVLKPVAAQLSEVHKHGYEVSNHMSEAGRRVRVCDYDRVYGFREDSPPQADQAAGRPFLGVPILWARKERVQRALLILYRKKFHQIVPVVFIG